MPTDTLESGNGQGAQGQPTSDASGAGSVQPSSNNAEMPSWASQLAKRLDDMERRAQGDKDRAVAKVSKELETWRPVLEKVQALTGMSPEQVAQVQREMEWDAIKQRVFSGEPQPVAAQPAQGAAYSVQKALQKYSLDVNDPDVVAIIRDNRDQTDQLLALADLGTARKAQPQPNPALNAAPPSGAPAGDNPERLREKYIADMQAARGNPGAVRDTKERYRKMGVPVDNIAFI